MKKFILLIMSAMLMTVCSSCGNDGGFDVKLKGNKITLPCEFSELGYQIEDSPYNKSYDGLYNVSIKSGDQVILLTLEADSFSDINDDTKVHGISIMNFHGGNTDLEINGLNTGSTKSEVKSEMGEPDNNNDLNFAYRSDGYLAAFLISKKTDSVVNISYYDERSGVKE